MNYTEMVEKIELILEVSNARHEELSILESRVCFAKNNTNDCMHVLKCGAAE